MKATTNIDQRLEAGMSWLDRRSPGWRRRVKPDSLVMLLSTGQPMADPERCLLAQAFKGGWEAALLALAEDGLDQTMLGFAPVGSEGYGDLGDVWSELLKKKKSRE